MATARPRDSPHDVRGNWLRSGRHPGGWDPPPEQCRRPIPAPRGGLAIGRRSDYPWRKTSQFARSLDRSYASPKPDIRVLPNVTSFVVVRCSPGGHTAVLALRTSEYFNIGIRFLADHAKDRGREEDGFDRGRDEVGHGQSGETVLRLLPPPQSRPPDSRRPTSTARRFASVPAHGRSPRSAP